MSSCGRERCFDDVIVVGRDSRSLKIIYYMVMALVERVRGRHTAPGSDKVKLFGVKGLPWCFAHSSLIYFDDIDVAPRLNICREALVLEDIIECYFRIHYRKFSSSTYTYVFVGVKRGLYVQ